MKRIIILIVLLCLGVETITAQSKKRVSILGDSYSTFEG
jgi:hypothetical protein